METWNLASAMPIDGYNQQKSKKFLCGDPTKARLFTNHPTFSTMLC